MRILVLAILGAALTGCVSASTRVNNRLSTWVGKSRDELVTSYGTPHAITRLDSGNDMYEYRLQGGSRASVVPVGGSAMVVQSNTSYCNLRFGVSPETKTIIGVKWDGNGC